MNRYIYTITTVLFLIIAGVTAYKAYENMDKGSAAPAVAEVQQPEVVKEEVAEEPEPEPVAEEPVEEEPEEEAVEYYTYKVIDASWLHMRDVPDLDSEPVATLPRGYTGYVVEMTGHWTLICADGYIGYCSDTYLEFEQIDESEFPEELKGYDENSAGTTIAEGKIGPVEEANSKSVRWR